MRLALLPLLAGCHVAFGLEHQPPLPTDADIDAPGEPPIAGDLAFEYLFNSAGFLPQLLRTIYPAAGLAITVADPATGAAQPVAYDETAGTFSVPRDGTAPTRVQLHFGAYVIEYQWSLPALGASLVVYAPVGASISPPGTTLGGKLTPGTPTTNPLQLVIYATGTWGAFNASFPPVGNYLVSWSGYLPSGAAHDQLIATGYDTDANGNAVIDRKQVLAPISLVGGANSRDITLAPIALSACIKTTTNLAADVARLDALYPGYSAGPAGSVFLVDALPRPDLGPALAYQLGRSPQGAASAMMAYEPAIFPGFTPMAATLVTRSRTVNNTAFTVSDQRFTPIQDRTCGTTLAMPAHTGALPSAFVLDGYALASDDVAVTRSGPTLALTWSANGPADLYQVQLTDVTTGAGVLHAYYATAPHVVVDASDFVPDHQYVIQVTATVGLPGIAQGDTTTFAYPLERATGASYAFTVQ